jgi:hypothetical protein
MPNIKKINGKIFKYIDSNIVEISPENKTKARPLFCPVCKFSMSNYSDFISYDIFTCCDFCAKKWAEKYRQEWSSGWRPASDEITKFKKERKKKINPDLS